MPSIKVGVDDGHAMTKIVFYDDNGAATQIAIASSARSGVHSTTSIVDVGGLKIFPGYQTDGSQFTVGDFRDAESTRFDDFPFSSMNRAIVHHALRVAGLGGRSVDIGTGLPLSRFYSQGKRNSSVISKKQESLSKTISAMDRSPMASIKSNRVFAEGLAAYIDYAMDIHGELLVDLNESIGIIDIGGRTTDIAVVVPEATLDHSRSGSENIGVLDLIEAIGISFTRKYGDVQPHHMLNKSLRTRSVKMWGKDVDIGEIIDECAKSVLERIMRETNRRLGSGIDLDKILLVGGGAIVFSGAASQYPNITIPKDPEFSNARGFAKYLSI